ncbi:unnamed protein product, partial [Schistosoma margrebowiei]
NNNNINNNNINNNNNNDNIDNDKSQFDNINKLINSNQNQINDYSIDLSIKNKQTEKTLLSNKKLNELNHPKYDISSRINQKQVNNSDMILYKYSHKEQDKIVANNNNNNNNNNKPYVSKHVDIQSNEKFLYNKQIIKSRQSSRYIILRPRKIK